MLCVSEMIFFRYFFFLLLNNICLCGRTRFVYSFSYRWTFELFLVCAILVLKPGLGKEKRER